MALYEAKFQFKISDALLGEVLETLRPYGVTVQLKPCPADDDGGVDPVAVVARVSTAQCPECGSFFTPDAYGNRYCSGCLETISRQGRALDNSIKKEMDTARAERKARKPYACTCTCRSCGQKFTASSGATKHCPECRDGTV